MTLLSARAIRTSFHRKKRDIFPIFSAFSSHPLHVLTISATVTTSFTTLDCQCRRRVRQLRQLHKLSLSSITQNDLDKRHAASRGFSATLSAASKPLERLKCTGNYSAASNNMKLVHYMHGPLLGELLHFGTARRGLGGAAARPGASSLYQM